MKLNGSGTRGKIAKKLRVASGDSGLSEIVKEREILPGEGSSKEDENSVTRGVIIKFKISIDGTKRQCKISINMRTHGGIRKRGKRIDLSSKCLFK